MTARRQGARNAAARAIAAGQLQLPLDIDELADVVGAVVEVEPALPHISALRIGNYVYLKPGLPRSKQRIHGGHEIGHVAVESASVDDLEHAPECIEDQETEANEFRNRVLVPPWELLQRIDNGETEEELCWAYGLEPEDLRKIYQSHLREVGQRMM